MKSSSLICMHLFSSEVSVFNQHASVQGLTSSRQIPSMVTSAIYPSAGLFSNDFARTVVLQATICWFRTAMKCFMSATSTSSLLMLPFSKTAWHVISLPKRTGDVWYYYTPMGLINIQSPMLGFELSNFSTYSGQKYPLIHTACSNLTILNSNKLYLRTQLTIISQTACINNI